MTDKYKTCDVCGYGELYAGVASSALGPMSQAYCSLCLGMGADSRIMIEATIDGCGGVENVAAWLCYFDREKDSYINGKTGEIVPIKTQEGKEYQTRSEWFKTIGWTKICDCPMPNCGKPVDISDWNMIDPMPCMCCNEAFEWEEVNKKRIRHVDLKEKK
jgi:hypothetical protein